MTARERYTFIGRDARGVARGGDTTIANLAEFVESRFRQGWTKLTVHHVPTKPTADGRTIAQAGVEWPLVAEIRPNADGQRSWWAGA